MIGDSSVSHWLLPLQLTPPPSSECTHSTWPQPLSASSAGSAMAPQGPVPLPAGGDVALWHWFLIILAALAWIKFLRGPTRTALGNAVLRTISAS